MKRSSDENNATAILSTSPTWADHDTLRNIFGQHSIDSEMKWKIISSSTLECAKGIVQRHQIPIAISERDLQPGSWRDLLEHMVRMPHLPLLIVTSRLADDRLWAEVLNLGGFDVLAKPFDAIEVTRVAESALRQWDNPLHFFPASTSSSRPNEDARQGLTDSRGEFDTERALKRRGYCTHSTR